MATATKNRIHETNGSKKTGMSLLRYTMRGTAPIIYGRPIHAEKRDDETSQQLEERTWRQKIHKDGDFLAIPSTAVHRGLMAAGAWLSMKLEGNKTYTKRLVAGILTLKPYFILRDENGDGLTEDSIEELPLYVPSDGKRGGPKRVWRTFPRVNPPWSLEAEFVVTDEALTESVLATHARCAGLHDGIGSMRIGNGGQNGMFLVEDLELEDYLL